MTAHQSIVLALLAAVAGCDHAGRGGRAPRSAREYAGVTFERAAELPGPPAAPGTAGAPAFERACAMRLRDPRSGRELLLVRSHITAPTTTESGATTTRLESATGDYARLTADGRGREGVQYLRVDCASGRAVGWVEPGA